MGVLKVRSNGQWINVGVGGGPLPAGGVLGDILVKQSANPSDAVWGTTMPKLKLTPGNVVGLDQNNPALMIGEPTGQNLVAYWGGLISRNNSAAATLRFNYYGGDVVVGGGETTQFPTAFLQVAETGHATSRRSHLKLGTGWEIGQDFSAVGTKDFYVYQAANARIPLRITADGLSMAVPATVTFPTGAKIDTTASELRLWGAPNLTMLGDTVGALNAAGSAWLFQHNSTDFNVHRGNLSVLAGSVLSASQVYTGTDGYFRVRGSSGIFWESWNGGWVMSDATWIQTYGGQWVNIKGGLAVNGLGGCQIRLNSQNDGNHILMFSNESAATIDPGSGQVSDGPKLQGYQTVWLRTVINGKSFLFAQSNTYLPSAGVYSKFSSRELKDDIEPLDPDACLADVARWEPVDYIVKDDPEKGRRDGFIAEDMDGVSPQLVVRTPADSVRPNRPHAIDYGAFTPRLTGAIQALLRRIEQLEGAA